MPLTLADLETPIPVVDLDRLARNLDRAAEYATAHKLALRPHVKTHKSPRIAAMQLERGAVGLTCATPFEAEVMSEVGKDLPSPIRQWGNSVRCGWPPSTGTSS